MQLELAGLVGKISYETDEGGSAVIGKALTKKGTTDMDRIASQIAKDAKGRGDVRRWTTRLDQ